MRSRWSSRAPSPGPAVLLGISLSTKDEPAFFRALVRLGSVLGGLPAAVLAKGAASMVKRIPVSADRQAELREDFRKNVPRHMQRGLREYVRWLGRHDRPAERLCQAGVPTWIVHAEKGDGGLTDDETLEACPHAHLVTLPGHVFFMPNEAPGPIADVIVEAVGSRTPLGSSRLRDSRTRGQPRPISFNRPSRRRAKQPTRVSLLDELGAVLAPSPSASKTTKTRAGGVELLHAAASRGAPFPRRGLTRMRTHHPMPGTLTRGRAGLSNTAPAV